MMLIVLDRYPTLASEKLQKMTSKQFIFKQLIELGQLICSTGISNVYKPVSRGEQIQDWITKNVEWTRVFFLDLLLYCKKNINMTPESYDKLNQIYLDIENEAMHLQKYARNRTIESVVFRYKKDYTETKYATNSLLPVTNAIEEYSKYIRWKFNNDNNKIQTKQTSKA